MDWQVVVGAGILVGFGLFIFWLITVAADNNNGGNK
jgi:hypothetical protein